MNAKSRFRATGIVVALACVMTLALVLPALQVCRDWAFIDRSTGSRKGYRAWLLGWRSHSWYRETGVEAFMRSNYPSEFHQDWVSYAGTGRNIFGQPLLYGHGRPGPIILARPESFDDYCSGVSDAENGESMMSLPAEMRSKSGS